jgi:hypothetical protein
MKVRNVSRFMQKRQVPLNPTTVGMLGILLLASSLRLVLMKLNWPVANADESIMDLMARHIAYQGEHPIFFWGQNYMGSIQAYLGAVLIHLVGSSAFSVRLGTLLIFALYLVCMYFLVRLLYTKAYALFTIALLSIGSDRMMSIPLVANGGYAETMLFGALIFLLASWLAFTMPHQCTRVSRSRLLAYVGLGVTIGLALWSDQLILTAIFTAGLFLQRCCYQKLRGQAIGALLLGLLVGATPLIIYNFSAAPGQNSLFVLLGTVFSGTPRVVPFSEQLAHVLLISLPLATGMPFTSGIHTLCGTVEPYTHPISSLTALFPSSNPWLCIGTRGSWSLGILLLWGIALTGVLLAIRQQRAVRQDWAPGPDAQAAWQQRTRVYARLMLLASGALWLLLFAFSAAAQYAPRASCRYLICLLFATPAILWPLWQSFGSIRERLKSGQRYVRSRFGLSALTLCVISGVYLVGTGDIFANLPVSQSDYNQTNTLIQTLLDHGAMRVYSDYNTCSLLIFQSDERVRCGVLDNQLRPGVNRYAPYLAQVDAAPHPAYLFPINSAPAQALALRLEHDARYQEIPVAGYTIYYYGSYNPHSAVFL